jgi:hypothetical protein
MLIRVRLLLLLFSLALSIHRRLARPLWSWPPKLHHPREENVNIPSGFCEKPLCIFLQRKNR